jgi:hypothetical protein
MPSASIAAEMPRWVGNYIGSDGCARQPRIFGRLI